MLRLRLLLPYEKGDQIRRASHDLRQESFFKFLKVPFKVFHKTSYVSGFFLFLLVRGQDNTVF